MELLCPRGYNLSTYAYADGDPLDENDPTGQFGVWGAAIGAGLDLGLQLFENGGSIRCVDFGSVIISAVMGAISPGIGDVNKAIRAASYARGAIGNLGEQLARTGSASRAAKVAQAIARNEAALYDANSTLIYKATSSAGKEITKALEAPTPLRIGIDCECKK